MTNDFFEPIVGWVSHRYILFIVIIVAALVAEYIGRKIIKGLVGRSLHGRHFGRPKQPTAEIKKRQETILSLALVVWKSIIFIIVIAIIVVSLFPQINILPLFASAGVLGAVVGFGAQSMIKDIISGTFIIVENQFRVGDVVELEGSGVNAGGTVEHISLRSTVLRDNSGNVNYFYNGDILHVINKTMGYSKVNFSLGVKPSANIDKAVEIIDKVGLNLSESEKWEKKIIEPPHFINLGALSDTAIELNISGKTVAGEQWAVTSELKKRLLQELRQHKDIHLSQASGLNLSLFSNKKTK